MKVIVVTGGTSGLGLELVKRFSARGDKVISISSTEEKINKAKESLGNLAENVLFLQSDLSDTTISGELKLKQLVNELKDKYIKIDILINCAGNIKSGGVEDLSIVDWTKTLNANLSSVYMVSRLMLDLLKASYSGSIVNISSISSRLLSSSLSYSVAKAGVDVLTKGLAKDLAKYKIRVNSINAGLFDSGFQVNNGIIDAKNYDYFLYEMNKEYPLGIGSTEEIVNLIEFITSDKCCWMTGSNVVIDGGKTSTFL